VILCAVFVRAEAANRMARLAECEFDVGIVSSQSVVLATALTLLLFSFDGAVSAVGLRAVPLSPAMLALSALAGVGLGQGRHTVEPSTVIRLVTTMFITPAVALLFGYFAVILFSPATLAFTSETFVVVLCMSVAVAVIFIVSNYLRHSLRSRMSERMLREQGRQLSENRRTLNELEVRNMQIENRNLHDLLELKRREVMSIALNINEQKEFMEGLYEKIKAVQAEASPAERQRMLAEIQTSLGQRMNFSNQIDNFYTEVEKLHKDFSIRLTEKFPKLTDSERRLTTLLRLGFSTKYIATLMNISPKSVEIGRHRLRAKLGLDRQQNLVAFVKTI
ncbi:MAG: LuxR C-terminal-related transcriptional regulator, partial [Alistipes sp.]|nr:LuxR C-terminal-related transcriptional regulator [Alistipes sp.]